MDHLRQIKVTLWSLVQRDRRSYITLSDSEFLNPSFLGYQTDGITAKSHWKG